MGGITTAGAPPTRYDWQNLEVDAAAAVASGAMRQGELAQPSLPVSSCQRQTSHSWTWQQGAEEDVREPVPLPGSNSSQGQTPQWAWQQGAEEVVREPVPPPGSNSSQGQMPNSWACQQGAEEIVKEPVPLPGSISSQGQIPQWTWLQGAEGVVREPSGSISSQGQMPHSGAWQQGAEGVMREPVPTPGFIFTQGRQIPNSWPFGDEEVGRGSTPPLVGVLHDDSIPFVPGKLIEEEDISPSPHELKRAEAETSRFLTNKPHDTGAVSGAEDPLGLVAALRERLQQMTAGLERVKAAADRLHERLDGPDAPLADRLHEWLDCPDAQLAERLHERLDGSDAPLADRLHERLDGPDAPLADRLHKRLDVPDAPLADSPSPSPSQSDGTDIGCSKSSTTADTTEVFAPLKNRQSDVSDSFCPCSSEPPGALEPSTTEALPKSMEVEEQPEREVKAISVSEDFIPTASAGLSNLISQQSTKRSPQCVLVWLKKEPVCFCPQWAILNIPPGWFPFLA